MRTDGPGGWGKEKGIQCICKLEGISKWTLFMSSLPFPLVSLATTAMVVAVAAAPVAMVVVASAIAVSMVVAAATS